MGLKTKKPVNTEFYEPLYSVEPLKVGMTRFELATPRPPDVCATGLRYIPKPFIFHPLLGSMDERGIAKVIEIFNFKNKNIFYLSATPSRPEGGVTGR